MKLSLPPGYIIKDDGYRRIIAPRIDLDAMVWLFRDGRPRGLDHDAAVSGGRGGAERITLPGGKRVFVRHYLRGGFVRHFVHDLFFLCPERPLRELVATEMARAAGVLVPRVCGALIEDVSVFYRGFIVTDEFVGARPFIDRFTAAPDQRDVLLNRLDAEVQKLVDLGIYHVDLTGHNVLVLPDDRVAVIDFDRAIVAAPRAERLVRRCSDRFWRSMQKLTAGTEGLGDTGLGDYRRLIGGAAL